MEFAHIDIIYTLDDPIHTQSQAQQLKQKIQILEDIMIERLKDQDHKGKIIKYQKTKKIPHHPKCPSSYMNLF